MKIETIGLRKITASHGTVLTNGEAFSDIGGSIFLGCNDTSDNWHEITEEDYNEILKAEEEDGDVEY